MIGRVVRGEDSEVTGDRSLCRSLWATVMTSAFSLRLELREDHERVMSGGEPYLTLDCNRIPLAAKSSVRGNSGCRDLGRRKPL